MASWRCPVPYQINHGRSPRRAWRHGVLALPPALVAHHERFSVLASHAWKYTSYLYLDASRQTQTDTSLSISIHVDMYMYMAILCFCPPPPPHR